MVPRVLDLMVPFNLSFVSDRRGHFQILLPACNKEIGEGCWGNNYNLQEGKLALTITSTIDQNYIVPHCDLFSLGLQILMVFKELNSSS